jgi:thiol-disulfide isomerase/thioredoxin
MLGISFLAPRPVAPVLPLAVIDCAGFEKAILPREGASLVLFGASWREPGRKAAAQLRRAGDRLHLLTLFVDVERSPELARRYRVTAIPSLLLFQGGQEAARRLGDLGEDDLEDWLAAALA